MNGDFFDSKGTSLILNSLKMRIEPFPLPKIGVFMNRARTYAGQPTKEAQFYVREVKRVCSDAAAAHKIDARFLDSWIPDRAGIKRAITGGGVPSDLIQPFKDLWDESVSFLK